VIESGYHNDDRIDLGEPIGHFLGSLPSGNPKRETVTDETGTKIIIESIYEIDAILKGIAVNRSHVIALNDVFYKSIVDITSSLAKENVRILITPTKI